MSIQWGLLREQGRVKEINVPWSDEELKALNVYKIPVEMVRKGVVTPEELVEEIKNPFEETKLLKQMSKIELRKLASDLNIEIPEDIHRSKIISILKNSKLPT